MNISRNRKQLYEGKAKILYEGPENGTIIQYFKDDATAFNNKKKGVIAGKGVLNNRISEFIMTRLGEIGIPTHFIRTLNMREQLVRAVEIIPLEVVVRNVAAGSLCTRLGVDEGTALKLPIIELYLKNDALGDPLVNDNHILTMGWADDDELTEIRNYAGRINDYLRGIFMGVGILLVDFKIEFGRFYNEDFPEIILADEISPDSCRLWDAKTLKKLDKDRFRRDLGGVAEAYHEVAKRLGVLVENVMEEEETPPPDKPKKKNKSSKEVKKTTVKKTKTSKR